MSSTPRIIATTASAALLAATGAGAAVMAVDTVTSGSTEVTADAATTTTDSVPAPRDDRVTVYQSPSDDHEDGEYDDNAPTTTKQLQPAPPSTSFQGNNGGKAQNNTSKSS